MPGKKESVFINSQSLNVDETVRSSVLKTIKDSKNLQEAIEQLEKEKLIWYLIGPLCKDEEVRKQINSKWEADFQKFEQSIDATHRELESSLPSQSFLAYSIKANDFNIRFESKEEPVKISDILRASSEGKVYHISLGGDNQITASKKNGNERHYDFTGSGSSKMTINWQAKDSEGRSIDSSMTIEVGSDGIQKVIDEPKFGEITDSEEVLKLVEQNKEVFINGKSLLEAFIGMGKNVINQPMQEEETFIRNPPESPQPPTPDSSGYSSLESPSIPSTDDEEELEQEEGLEDEIEKLKSEIKELEEENAHLKKENTELKSRNEKIIREGDNEISQLGKEKQALEEKVKELRTKLEKSEKELDSKNQDIRQLKQRISILEQSQEDKNARIADLKSQLKDKESQIQLTNRANKELQEGLGQSEAELNKLRAENAKLKNDLEKIILGDLEDGKEKQLTEQLKEIKKENKTLTDEVSRLVKELNQLQKEKEDLERKTQQPSGKSLAEEIAEVNEKKDEEMKQKDEQIQQIIKEKGELEEKFQMKIDRLKQQLEDRENMITHAQKELYLTKENLKQLQEENKQLKNIGVDQPPAINKKEVAEVEIQPQNIMDWPVPMPNDKPEKLKTPLEPTKVNKTSKIVQNIMDWPVPIPDDKLEEQRTPLEPTKVNTELSNPSLTSVEDPKKSRHKA
ncbi:MAG: Chromosome partition protein Smc [Wolbachia endosymbiont of Ctenocephalides felis wCfeF]|nr:MAG: Chromosome partition protein Smc [Wolbachia endosymbiont of Ctenocephalides felis wCfeF]